MKRYLVAYSFLLVSLCFTPAKAQLSLQASGIGVTSATGVITSVNITKNSNRASLLVNENANDFGIYSQKYGQSVSIYLPSGDNVSQAYMKITNIGNTTFPQAGLSIGRAEIAGTIRWSGTDFVGYDGSQWVSLSGKPVAAVWTTAIQPGGTTYYNNPCRDSCPAGWVAAADPLGKVCKSTDGQTGIAVTAGFQGGVAYHRCDGRPLGQCYCIR